MSAFLNNFAIVWLKKLMKYYDFELTWSIILGTKRDLVFSNSLVRILKPDAEFFKFSDHNSVGKLIQLCNISKIIFLLGETPKVYNSHVLKTKMGHILCPVLYNYICPHCGNTGDNAHTLRYCPYAESKHQFFMFTRSNKNHFKLFDIHYLLLLTR